MKTVYTEQFEGPCGSGETLQLTFDEDGNVVNWFVLTPVKDTTINATTERLVDVLMTRGYRVTLERPAGK